MQIDRRGVLRTIGKGAVAIALQGGNARAQTAMPQADTTPPILFVHGNGDDASFWETVLWRFESNSYPADRLFAFSFTDPSARDDDGVPQPGRSSTQDQLRELAAQVDRVRAATGAPQIALVGSSRGGLTIRNYVSNAEAARAVGHVVLCGVPNHGVFSWLIRTGNEFNGRGAFLERLNATAGEIVPGPRFLTLRSDGQDKYAVTDGRFLGYPGLPTGVSADGPALSGATNLVLGPLDHRETATHPRAFREIYAFITGREPGRIEIVPQDAVRIGGVVTAVTADGATNRPLAGAQLEIYALSPETGERQGDPVWKSVTDSSGAWGPAMPPANAPLEFVLTSGSNPVTHLYRPAFPRSSSVINLRPARVMKDSDRSAAAIVTMSRPRGYFGLPRDIVSLDGHEPSDVTPGIPSMSTATLRLADATARPLVCLFNEERIVCRPWPASDGHVTLAEFTF